MKPAPFSIHIPDTVEEALACLSKEGEDARVIAGGQSLMAMLNMRLAEPGILVDISRLGELKGIELGPDGLTVGAAVTQAEVFHHPDLPRYIPIIREALSHVGHIQTRNRGTICGSLCHADPSAEMPLMLATLGGRVTLASTSGSRELSASEFQTGLLETARTQQELCVSAHFPSLPETAKWGFREISRRDGDFAIVAMACVADQGTVRLGVSGVSDAPTVEEWSNLMAGDIPDLLNRLAWKMGGYDDIHASARYRRELVRRIGKKLIEEVLA
ncbi:MAG: hypothetical protein VR71_11560 [Roseovarius sp. BRH_c41]|uniref:FAD binding domain-containing protein n=1 Tax=Roseovarius sp. BRH_c41 TaxID=1629709 RepID=UPI0005F1912C|nr:FAD binding domain-containing protein [Roseovarius sp. BRH_c41]KJS43204.1 MAG: hypothetical protein VR71_11560 [Roseovarius sp. BRH_c41]